MVAPLHEPLLSVLMHIPISFFSLAISIAPLDLRLESIRIIEIFPVALDQS